jgi:uncharacterized membrane protein
MSYDRDLRITRTIALVVAAAEVGLSVGYAVDGSWLQAGACLLWVCVCLLWRRLARCWQVTRDLVRLTDSALHGVIEHRDREEEER